MKILSVLICSLISISIVAATITGKVIKIYDGDTIRVIDEDDGKFVIRFANIDSPEKNQIFGKESTEFLSKLLSNNDVIVKFTKIDVYGRIVGNVYITITDNENTKVININEEMLKNGYAWFYSTYSKDNNLKSLELNARKNKLGLWKSENPKEPWIFRKEQKALKAKHK